MHSPCSSLCYFSETPRFIPPPRCGNTTDGREEYGVEEESPHLCLSAEPSPDDDPAEKKKEVPPPYQYRSYCNKNHKSLSKEGEEEVDGDKDDYEGTVHADPGHAWYFTYEELRPLLLHLILGRDETAGSVGQNNEYGDDDGDDGGGEWSGWMEMRYEEGGDGGDDDASEYIAEVEGGGQDVSGQRRRV